MLRRQVAGSEEKDKMLEGAQLLEVDGFVFFSRIGLIKNYKQHYDNVCDERPATRSLEQIVQRRDVRLGHLQRLVLGQLPVVAERGQHGAESVESLVQVLHAPAFAGVGG